MADITTDEEIDAALERAEAFDNFPRILEAVYRPEPGLEFLMLRLSDGRRLLIPREELGELKNSTSEQAVDLKIGTHGVDIWWPQLNDGLYLPDFLKYRWGKGRTGRSLNMRYGQQKVDVILSILYQNFS